MIALTIFFVEIAANQVDQGADRLRSGFAAGSQVEVLPLRNPKAHDLDGALAVDPRAILGK